MRSIPSPKRARALFQPPECNLNPKRVRALPASRARRKSQQASKIQGLSVSRDSSPSLGAELLRSSIGGHQIGTRFLGVLFMEAVDGFDFCEVVLQLPSRVRVSSPPNEIL